MTAGSIVAGLDDDAVPTDVDESVEDLPASDAAVEPRRSRRELKAQAKAARRQKREQARQHAAAAREQAAAEEAAAREQAEDTDAPSGVVSDPEPQPVPPSEASIGLAERLEAERTKPVNDPERSRREKADAGTAEAKAADRPDRTWAKQARLEAKQVARQQRNEDRQKAADADARARAAAAAAKAAERVDTRTAEMEAPELSEPSGLVEADPPEPPTTTHDDLAAEAAVVPTSDVRPDLEAPRESERPTELAIATAAAAVARNLEDERHRTEAQEQQRLAEQAARDERAEAKAARRRQRAEAKEAARREREQAKQAARPAHDETATPVDSGADRGVADDMSAPVVARQLKAGAKEAARREREQAKQTVRRERVQAKQTVRQEREEARTAARSAKAVRRAEKQGDHIVEAPREPKVSLTERLRRKGAAGEPGATPGGRNGVTILAVIIGALGLTCSLVLAIGAFMAALGTTDSNGAYDVLSAICDVLVGPLRDLFSFSGSNADMKEAVVAWGAGSMIYVFVGMFAQSYLRSRADDG